MEISKLKVIVMSKETHQPLSNAKIYWDRIPESVRNKNMFCKQYKDSESGLQIDLTNSAGFSLLWGEIVHKKQLWFYIHKIMYPEFKEAIIEKKVSVKSGSEREITLYLTHDNK